MMDDNDLLAIINTPIVKGNDVFIAPQAVVIGNVFLGNSVSIMFHAVIRGDGDKIMVGSGTNIQEHAMIHVDPGFPCTIGDYCTIGHGAIVHGAILDHLVLVGMHATILNGAKIGTCSIIGAGALVTENMVVPPFSLVVGVPGKVVKTLNESIVNRIQKNADTYQQLGRVYRIKFDK